MAKETLYDEPRTMYFRSDYGCVKAEHVSGETSRSWIGGYCKWDRILYSKLKYTEISRDEYDEYMWAIDNAYRIAKRIYNYNLAVTPAQLRQIAQIIGYEEEK